jgi:uncharacterized protein
MRPKFLLKRWRILLLLLILIALTVAGYAYKVEPYQVEVTHHRLSAALQSPVKIAHLSDLHTYGIGRREEKLLAILAQEKPDLIVITGDSISEADGFEGCLEVLKRLQAPLGVWVVLGNHEHWATQRMSRVYGNFKDYYASAGVNLLHNANMKVRDDLWLIGLDDAMAGNPDIARGFAGVPDNVYKITLFHAPAAFDEVAGKCNVAFAGHSHGGQVRIPFIKPFWLPQECGEYVDGWFERNGSKMYVSRGLGTSVLPIRFNCRPEIAFITLG